MDKQELKYATVLDIIEHPDNYSPEQQAEILSDPESREIYNLLCKTDAAVSYHKEVDVDAEWELFSRKNAFRRRSPFMWFGSRAASVAAIIVTSIVAVAAAIAFTVAVKEHKAMKLPDGNASEIASTSETGVSDTSAATTSDADMAMLAPKLFEDETLEAIMKEISEAYDVEVRFTSPEAASLHLYYKFDPTLPLDEVVSQLNTFEQLRIERNGNLITID